MQPPRLPHPGKEAVMALELRSNAARGTPSFVPAGDAMPDRSGDVRVQAPMLSPEAIAVLQAALDEQLAYGDGAPLDTADLLIGLLQNSRTRELLEEQGITVDRIRTAKRRVEGYRLAQ